MKKVVAFVLAVAAALGLTATAFADVISPGELILREAGSILPWVLVAAVVVVTVLLLRRKKK